VTNINSVCRAWRDAADKDLWQKLIARRWYGVETMYGEFDSHWIETMAERHLPAKADRQCALAWRDAFFDRALGRQLRRAVLQSVDLSDVLGKRLAPNAFSLHHTGWSIFSMGGKTMFAPIFSVNQVMSLGSHAKILEMSGTHHGRDESRVLCGGTPTASGWLLAAQRAMHLLSSVSRM